MLWHTLLGLNLVYNQCKVYSVLTVLFCAMHKELGGHLDNTCSLSGVGLVSDGEKRYQLDMAAAPCPEPIHWRDHHDRVKDESDLKC